MVWLIAGLPAIAVIASFTTYFIAADKPDTLVNAGYHKEGLAPIKDTSREELAAVKSITAELEIGQREIRVRLAGQMKTMPDHLEMLLLHPVDAAQDVRITLTSLGNGLYSAPEPATHYGKQQWILEPDIQDWRLTGELTLPLSGPLNLVNHGIRTPL